MCTSLTHRIYFNIHGSVHRNMTQQKYQPDAACNRIYYSKVYWKLNMFRAAHRSSTTALNCTCSLWFIYACGDWPLSRPWQWPVTTWAY